MCASCAVLAAQLHALHLGAASVLPSSSAFGAREHVGEAGLAPLMPQLSTAQTRSSSPESSDQRSPHQLDPPLLTSSELLSRLQLGTTAVGVLPTSGAVPPPSLPLGPLERSLHDQHLIFPQQQHNHLQQHQQHAHLLQQQALLQQQQLLELQPASGRRRGNAGRRNEEKVRRTVYISDISDAVTEAQLAAFFQDCGQLVDCRVCGDPNSSMRFAFIEFITEEAAKQV